MKQVIVLLEISMFLIAGKQAFKIFAEENLNCQTSSIQCISNTTYTTCANLGSFTMLLNSRITCPDGYICNDSASTPCVSPDSQDNGTDRNSVTTTTVEPDDDENVTNATTTTVASVTRPTGPPECNTEGFSPAFECDQYYECVKKKGFFARGYQAEIRTCSSGNYFDTSSLSCVPAAESDCS